jgi:acyl carrier protein
MSRASAQTVGPRQFDSCKAFGEALIAFILGPLARRRGLALKAGAVGLHTPLFSDGLIDSIGILDLIAFVEAATGRVIPTHMVDMKYFRSVHAICEAFWSLDQEP